MKTADEVNKTSLEVSRRIGETRLGVLKNWEWHDDPRRLAISLSRYKFVAKMFKGRESVLEVGCGDGFCAPIVRQEVKRLTITDVDPVYIADIKARAKPPEHDKWPIDAVVVDIRVEDLPGQHDGIYALDVFEHIPESDEDAAMRRVIKALAPHGAVIIGMPSLESQDYASPQSKAGHVNCKTEEQLRSFMQRHFENVFIFAMNDEVVHTGFGPMAHYRLALACGPKKVISPAERYRALIAERPNLVRNLPGGIDIVTDAAETARIEAAMAERFAAKGMPREWARAGVFYEDPYLMVLRDAVIFPDGKSGLYHRAIARHDGPTGVAILGRYRGDFILLRHFRHPTRDWHLEIPRGAVAIDETATQMAQVEISEEIGGTITSMTQMGVLHGASAFMRHRVVLVYAEFSAIGTPALGEGIAEIVPVAPAELERMIRESAITDSFTVAAAYHAKLRGLL